MSTYILHVDCEDPATLLGDTVTRRFTVDAVDGPQAAEKALAAALAAGLLPLRVVGL